MTNMSKWWHLKRLLAILVFRILWAGWTLVTFGLGPRTNEPARWSRPLYDLLMYLRSSRHIIVTLTPSLLCPGTLSRMLVWSNPTLTLLSGTGWCTLGNSVVHVQAYNPAYATL